MMRRGHALTGALAGVGLAAAAGLYGAPLAVRLAGIGVTTACVFLPDLDSPRATAVRVLNLGLPVGPGTLVHALLVHLSKALFYLTRTASDRESAGSGHRQFTHTLVCALLCGALAGWGCTRLPWPPIEAWWWFWGLAVALGHAVGIAGDWLTIAGVPALWPLKINGKRWYDLRAPITFHTNSLVEKRLVYPGLWIALAGASLYTFWGI